MYKNSKSHDAIVSRLENSFQKYSKVKYGSNDNIFGQKELILYNFGCALSQVFQLITSRSKVRDTFTEPSIHATRFDFILDTVSEKMNVSFSFGFWEGVYFIQSHLENPYYIKSMDDGFWSNLLKLNSLGKFSFYEKTSTENSEAEYILKCVQSKKSNIFKLIQNYILLETYRGGSVDIGALEVSWPSDTSISDLIEKATNAFKILHHTNYQLYRRDYQSRNRKNHNE